jgi:hypothetical protein
VRVLVGCEESGKVRDAFLKRGHDAWSCDLQPTRSPGPHYKRDVIDVLENEGYWDLAIFHPVCRYLTNSGVRWLHTKEGRWNDMIDAAGFFNQCNRTEMAGKVCTENPIPHSYARQIIGDYTQIIHPWMFDHPQRKATCLWLRGLPDLIPVTDLREEMKLLPKSVTDECHYMSPGPDRERKRSETYSGIAEAFAEQWG